MKISLFIASFCLLFLSCDKKSAIEKEIEEIPMDVKIERFDKLFFESAPANLSKIKQQFPFFFPSNVPDSVWTNKIQNPLWRELYTEVQKKYADISPVKTELDKLFKHQKFYFPKDKIPNVVTIISEMDFENRTIYTDSLLIISLEVYLGKSHKFYEIPNYIKKNCEPRQIVPDVVSSFSSTKINPEKDRNFLSQMIAQGKELYLKDLLLPSYTDAEKIGYTPEEIVWCQENQVDVWRYFLEKELLYSEDRKLITRFIAPAPFSKFYLEIDNDSPGRVGAWIGWQIVRSYAENNPVPLDDLLKMNYRRLFEQSKYKPKKE